MRFGQGGSGVFGVAQVTDAGMRVWDSLVCSFRLVMRVYMGLVSDGWVSVADEEWDIEVIAQRRLVCQ